jgi:hypothetical protein
LTEPELALWRAVIAQAFADANHCKPRKTKRGGGGGTTYAEQRHARLWLTKPSADFRLVCHLALLDPDAVREKALQQQAKRWGVRRRNNVRRIEGSAA